MLALLSRHQFLSCPRDYQRARACSVVHRRKFNRTIEAELVTIPLGHVTTIGTKCAFDPCGVSARMDDDASRNLRVPHRERRNDLGGFHRPEKSSCFSDVVWELNPLRCAPYDCTFTTDGGVSLRGDEPELSVRHDVIRRKKGGEKKNEWKEWQSRDLKLSRKWDRIIRTGNNTELDAEPLGVICVRSTRIAGLESA